MRPRSFDRGGGIKKTQNENNTKESAVTEAANCHEYKARVAQTGN